LLNSNAWPRASAVVSTYAGIVTGDTSISVTPLQMSHRQIGRGRALGPAIREYLKPETAARDVAAL